MNHRPGHARVTSKGQVTIPKDVREKLCVKAGDEIEFVHTMDGILIRRAVPEVSPFRKYLGCLEHLHGEDSDDLVEEMRGR